MSKHGNGNAALATNARTGESEIEACQRQIGELRKAFATMAALVLPAHMRNYCACGRLACRQVDAVNPQGMAKSPELASAKPFTLCDQCALPEGFTAVRSVELAPAERETVRLANELACLRLSQPASSPS
jgi:hypothetical protein